MNVAAEITNDDSRLHISAVGDRQVRGYRPELDVVRFFAFLLVFFHHQFALDGQPSNTGRLYTIGWSAFLSFANACAMGLCLFFALSAYLITSLLLEERENRPAISVRRFYFRRALRIWPLYFFGILIGLSVAIFQHDRHEITAFVWYLLFAGNVFRGLFGWGENPMMPLWSISIEEQFYLIWPWAMRWLSKRGLTICAFAFIAVANVTLFIMGQQHADTTSTVWTSTFVQFEMFAIGILLALAENHGVRKERKWLGCGLALAGPILFFLACSVFHVKQPGKAGLAASGLVLMMGYGLVALGCAAILRGFAMIGPSDMPRWATNLGKISYGLYVYHMLVGKMVHQALLRLHIVHSYGAYIPLSLLLTILLAKCSYVMLESPFLRLKRRFEIVHSRPV